MPTFPRQPLITVFDAANPIALSIGNARHGVPLRTEGLFGNRGVNFGKKMHLNRALLKNFGPKCYDFMKSNTAEITWAWLAWIGAKTENIWGIGEAMFDVRTGQRSYVLARLLEANKRSLAYGD